MMPQMEILLAKQLKLIYCHVFCSTYIDSLDGLTFRNQLMPILLVMPTGQHLHVINTKNC